MCLGLRDLRGQGTDWQDLDLKRQIPTLARSIVAGTYGTAARGTSKDDLALDPTGFHFWRIGEGCEETPVGELFANADTKRQAHGDVIEKEYLRRAAEKIGLQRRRHQQTVGH